MENNNQITRSFENYEKLPDIEEETRFTDLPPELIEKILSLLSQNDAVNMSLANDYLNQLSIDTSIYQDFSKIKQFINLLIDHLNKATHSKEINQLSELIQTNNFLDLKNLKQAKERTLEYKKNIILIVSQLDIEIVQTLENISKHKMPRFFENLFKLVPFYKSFTEASQMHNPLQSLTTYDQMFSQLIEANEFEEAIQLAKNIPEEAARSHIISHVIPHNLMRIEAFEKALDYVKRVNSARMNPFLCTLGLRLMRNNKIEQAIEAIDLIKNNEDKELYFFNMANELLVTENFDSSATLKIIYHITNISNKSVLLKNVTKRIMSNKLNEQYND